PSRAEEAESEAGQQLVRYAPTSISKEQLAELRLEVAAGRPRFVARAAGPLTFELIENPWFTRYRVLHVQSAMRIPAMDVMAFITPCGNVRLLSGQPATFNRVARAERIAFGGEEDARAYALIVMSWMRAADFPELLVESFEEIPFRDSLSAEEH